VKRAVEILSDCYESAGHALWLAGRVLGLDGYVRLPWRGAWRQWRDAAWLRRSNRKWQATKPG